MLRFLMIVLEKYGLQVANLVLLGFVSWKLFSNHLKHISKDIKDLKGGQKEIDKKVDKLSERVSKVEGKLEK